MKKTGLILANPGTNYGAHLQAFATQYVMDQMGVQTEILDYTKIQDSPHYYIDWGFVVFLKNALLGKFARKKQKPTNETEINNLPDE